MSEGIVYCKRPAADFDLAFTPGHRFLRGDSHLEMNVLTIGDLRLPTGRIVAADPGNLDDRVDRHFIQGVAPGTYPVDIAVCRDADHNEDSGIGDTACMRVRFGEQAPVSEWVIGATPGENPDELEPFQIFGYGVDVGMGAFADSAGLKTVLRKYQSEGKTLFDEFYFEQVLPAYEANDCRYADLLLDPQSGSNLVICNSGFGDGFYASYWGLDAARAAAMLDHRLRAADPSCPRATRPGSRRGADRAHPRDKAAWGRARDPR